MKRGHLFFFGWIARIIVIAGGISLIPSVACAWDWNPLNWFKSEIVPKNRYTLVFWKPEVDSTEVFIIKPTNDFKLECEKESGEKVTYDCNDIKEIVENNLLKTGSRVGLATLVAGGAMAAITGGLAIPIVLAAGVGGSASYITRGASPQDFCHN